MKLMQRSSAAKPMVATTLESLTNGTVMPKITKRMVKNLEPALVGDRSP